MNAFWNFLQYNHETQWATDIVTGMMSLRFSSVFKGQSQWNDGIDSFIIIQQARQKDRFEAPATIKFLLNMFAS